MIAAGMSCQLPLGKVWRGLELGPMAACLRIHYTHEEHDKFFEVCKNFNFIIVRCNPGLVVSSQLVHQLKPFWQVRSRLTAETSRSSTTACVRCARQASRQDPRVGVGWSLVLSSKPAVGLALAGRDGKDGCQGCSVQGQQKALGFKLRRLLRRGGGRAKGVFSICQAF